LPRNRKELSAHIEYQLGELQKLSCHALNFFYGKKAELESSQSSPLVFYNLKYEERREEEKRTQNINLFPYHVSLFSMRKI